MRNLINSTVKEEPKVQCHHEMPPFAVIIPFCTAITMRYNSYAMRSQTVLTTKSTGRIYNVQFKRVRVQGTAARRTLDRYVRKLRHNSRTKLHIQVCHAVHKLTGCKAASCRQLCLQRSVHHHYFITAIQVCNSRGNLRTKL